jgi:hypothetical protein
MGENKVFIFRHIIFFDISKGYYNIFSYFKRTVSVFCEICHFAASDFFQCERASEVRGKVRQRFEVKMFA